MEESQIWLQPLILLPGVALLVMSTSARVGQLHGEIHRTLEHRDEEARMLQQNLFVRARLFRNALVGLYGSIALFVISALIGWLLAAWGEAPGLGVQVLMIAGVCSLLSAVVMLVREAVLIIEVFEFHEHESRRDIEPHDDARG